jgi:WD40 repeat protein
LEADTGKQRDTLPDRMAAVAAWSPDSQRLATGYTDGSVRLWNAATRQQIAILTGHRGPVKALIWSPDGKTLASGSQDHTAVLWDPAARRQRATLAGHTGEIQALAWSPDGKTLATGSVDGSLRLWRAATGKLRAACYAIDQGREWVTFTSEGYFRASKHGADYIEWRVGDRLWPVRRFRQRFERADLIRRALTE